MSSTKWLLIGVLVFLCSFSVVIIEVVEDGAVVAVAVYPSAFVITNETERAKWTERYPDREIGVTVLWFCGVLAIEESAW